MVAILFNRMLGENYSRVTELEQGRVLIVQAEITKIGFIFIKVYIPNNGTALLQNKECTTTE